MAAFEGNAPTYHLEFRDRPVLVWDFHSLLLNIKMVLDLKVTDEAHPLRLCKQCYKPFLVAETNEVFCSPQCEKKTGVRTAESG